jgi:hypothetical protein
VTNITTSGVDAANAYNAAGVGNTTISADSALKGLVSEPGNLGFAPETLRVQDVYPSLGGQVSPTATLVNQAGTTIQPTGFYKQHKTK